MRPPSAAPQLPSWDSKLIGWLVQSHLSMSTTAQRKDLSDPQVISDFAHLVGDQTRLDYLYVLTVADINATNPSLWNSWRASLRQLYTETKRAPEPRPGEPTGPRGTNSPDARHRPGHSGARRHRC